ncbi:MAG TPA: hypothetical protein VKF32_09930, partial [Thermoanaerobaculia bacterium]|nr:hypothetical protein [Thermoanaerobaculia bacterium]
LGDIDHHFWEPPLLTALVGAALSLRKAGERDVVLRGALFGLALLAALFIQTTFLFAAGVLAAALLLVSADEPRTLAAAAVGYGVALLGVTAWRLARPPGIPDYEWYLGWPQIAALAAAAIACAAGAALVRGPRTARILVSVAAGTAVALAVPHAALGLVDGAALFGDPWIRTMVECRSVFENEAPWRTALYVFGGGVLLLPVLLFGAAREKSRGRLLFGLVALVYVAAAVSSLRFSIAAAPLVAISAAAVVGDTWRAGRRLLAGAAALVALGPGLVFAAPSIATPSPSVPPEAAPMLRVTSFLRAHPGGRVLGPLSWGHLFDVAGLHPAVLDNFGSMIGREPFRARLRVFLLTDEAAVARWCRASGVRWVVLEPPFTALPLVVESLGEPLLPYLRPPPCPGGAFTFTRRTQATFWWRAFYDGGRARPEMGRFGTPFRSFRLAYRDAQPAGVGPYRGPSAEVWELVEASPSP